MAFRLDCQLSYWHIGFIGSWIVMVFIFGWHLFGCQLGLDVAVQVEFV